MLFSSADFKDRALPIAATQGVGILCGILGIAVVSRLVPPIVLGAYGVYLTFTTLGMWLVHLGLTKFLNRQWALAPDRPALLRGIVRQWARKLGWLALAAAVAAGWMTRVNGSSFIFTFPVLFVSAAMLSVLSLAQAAFQADRAHWADFWASAVGSLSRTFFPPLLFLLSGKSEAWLYLGFLSHACLAAAVSAWMLRRHWTLPRLTVAQLVVVQPIYLGPLFTLLAAASWMLYGLNRWVVAAFFGDYATGLFTLASNISALLPSVLGAMALQYFQPGLYSLFDSGPANVREALLRRVDLIVATLGIVGFGGILLLRWFSPLLVGTLIEETYRDALHWIIPSGCFGLAIATNQFFHVALLAARRERVCAIVDLTSAGALTLAAIVGAWAGENVYWWILTLSPLCTWVLTRTMAHAVWPAEPASASTP